ncbi:probable tetraacyldisaccharide 4'-kinase, mitochondrial isoform X1 [Morus notabilis]|uniref:probable tetraacyldisaccharide 4'-kinase, mitochondrial isoform X1 n=1 Tax=Morus notabilis TaxID=981085 RepID=UPI000CECF1FD|nr:probable tetraacyldisaccharide 4'-kinase, mitochondrial isoform X1 [Morus notabilis]
MEKLRKAVNEIAYAHDHRKLSPLHRSLVPVLSLASSLYNLALSLRHSLYRFGLLRRHRLLVPVISVGNLTWGGNGKTPTVEFIARWLADSEISPLILSRGYAGGDEAKMLQRHLLGRSVKIGVGANRAATAASFIEKYGYLDPSTFSNRLFIDTKRSMHCCSEKIGAAILDDGMQHWSLQRDIEIVMVNGLTLWGNGHLLPRGPLREPLNALRRADIVILHHADLIPEQNLKDIELMIRETKESLPIFFTRMAPSHFFDVRNFNSKKPLEALCNTFVLCVSAIGSANAFVQGMKKLGAVYVDQLEFSDHHMFKSMDMEMIRKRLGELEKKFCSKPVVVVTEKDYDRDPDIFKHLDPFEVLALCCELQLVPYRGFTEDRFKKLLKEILEHKLQGRIRK